MVGRFVAVRDVVDLSSVTMLFKMKVSSGNMKIDFFTAVFDAREGENCERHLPQPVENSLDFS